MEITHRISGQQWHLRLICCLVSVMISLLSLSGFALPAAAANHWQMVAQSADHQQAQYIDLSSIAQTGAIVRLQTYWMDQRQPEAKTYALTEYHCDRQQFRDLELNGKPHQGNWQTVQADPLNEAVMDYVCSYRN